MISAAYDASIFINCPFDTGYKDLFDAVVFTVYDCGFVARCSREIDDASQIRIEKIASIIGECRFGIHDISRIELDLDSGLPRFNMPFELGLFLGAKRFGDGEQRRKLCLILDYDQYRYQKSCSDIAGQDIHAHQGSVERVVREVRDWLRSSRSERNLLIPSGSIIYRRYTTFLDELPVLCEKLHLDPDQLIFNDYTLLVSTWLQEYADW